MRDALARSAGSLGIGGLAVLALFGLLAAARLHRAIRLARTGEDALLPALGLGLLVQTTAFALLGGGALDSAVWFALGAVWSCGAGPETVRATPPPATAPIRSGPRIRG